MKPLLLALCFSLAAAEAQAISRYNSSSMSCAEVQATVRGEGAAILRYRSTRNPSLQLYGRYVSDRRSGLPVSIPLSELLSPLPAAP